MKIKGNVLAARIAYVKEHFGADQLESVIQTLPAEDQAILRGLITNVGWYSFDLGKRLDEAIVRVLGKGEPRIFEEIGAASARKNLTTVHTLFLDKGNPQGFMSRAHVIYRSYYDTGRREYEATGPTSGVMTTYEAETFSTFDCLTIIGWYKEALAMCGAKNVVMFEEVCRAKGGEFCRYRVSWE
ncbi:MAG TPA: TIGR02265 family protein [Blastocatellia bacterium]|nr:TIGR02265 family protein [Blastocatellia bacterium]